MFDTRVHASAVALIVNPKNELLMAQRADGASNGSGMWSVVGGWMDYGESPEQTVLRELTEEVGLESDEAYLHHALTVTNDPPLDSVVTLFYRVPYSSIFNIHQLKNVEPEKMSALEWIPMTSVMNLQLFKPFFNFWIDQTVHKTLPPLEYE